MTHVCKMLEKLVQETSVDPGSEGAGREKLQASTAANEEDVADQ